MRAQWEPMPAREIFVNLAVADLDRSVAFFRALGFTFDERFTDDLSACMVVNERAFVMFLARDFFASFTTKPVVDATRHTEAIVALFASSRGEVDSLVEQALAAGATPSNAPMEDGPMYGWSFQDLDGHLWEVISMDATDAEPTDDEPDPPRHRPTG